MYQVNRAKYTQHPDLQDELLSTGDIGIDGAPSTGWVSRSGKKMNWSLWNGLIQMRIREELRSPEYRNCHRLAQLEAMFDEYREQEGGNLQPLPSVGEEFGT